MRKSSQHLISQLPSCRVLYYSEIIERRFFARRRINKCDCVEEHHQRDVCALLCCLSWYPRFYLFVMACVFLRKHEDGKNPPGSVGHARALTHTAYLMFFIFVNTCVCVWRSIGLVVNVVGFTIKIIRCSTGNCRSEN